MSKAKCDIYVLIEYPTDSLIQGLELLHNNYLYVVTKDFHITYNVHTTDYGNRIGYYEIHLHMISYDIYYHVYENLMKPTRYYDKTIPYEKASKFLHKVLRNRWEMVVGTQEIDTEEKLEYARKQIEAREYLINLKLTH